MAVGVLFGVLAGIPTALLVLASDRRRQEPRDGHSAHSAYGHAGGQLGYNHYPQQPPVIVVTSGTPAQLGQQPHYGQSNPYAMTSAMHAGMNSGMTAQPNWQRPARSFRMVGLAATKNMSPPICSISSAMISSGPSAKLNSDRRTAVSSCRACFELGYL